VEVLETGVPTYRITVRNRSDQAARAIRVHMFGARYQDWLARMQPRSAP